MSPLEWVYFGVATLALVGGGVWSVRVLIAPPRHGAHLATPVVQWCVFIALVGYTLFLVARGRQLHFLPVSNVFEAVTFFLWCSIVMTVLVSVRARMETLPTFLLPFLAVLGVVALLLVQGPGEIREEIRRGGFLVHMLCAFLGYAAFTVAAITASIYVLQERRLRHKKLSGISRRVPPLEALDKLSQQLLALGFPLFTVAVALGVLLQIHSHILGDDWLTDPKVISAAVTWIVYCCAFVGSRTTYLYGRKTAWFTLAGYLGVMFTFLGTTILLGAVHGNV